VFESLTERLDGVLARLTGRGRISERDLDEALREVRLALLEADVHYRVVRDLVARIRERALTAEVLDSLSPGQNVLRVVRDALQELMGGTHRGVELRGRPAMVLLMGLQGSGKTTTAAKLALQLRKGGRRPGLATADSHRPAAREQLRVLGDEIGIPVFAGEGVDPASIPEAAKRWAREQALDVVVVDTAGRLQIDDAMMVELDAIAAAAAPDETLLVVDAMTGQDAVNVAATFHDRIGVSGVVLTKLDGDARGGAALSIRAVTGAAVKFVGVGERPHQLEPFHPDRMAARILGMGDVLTLVEQAEEAIDEKTAQRLASRMAKNRFTLQDFLEQLEEMSKLGPLSQILEKLPGMRKAAADPHAEDQDVPRALAILRSMTVEERLNPSIIGGSRKKRIAVGSGTRVRDVNRLLSQFDQARRVVRQLGGRQRRGMPSPFDLLGG
jgi:signal recognition particle subunit SRP54